MPGRGSSGGSPVGRLRAVAVRIVIRTRAVAAARRKLIPPGMRLQANAVHSTSNLEVYTTLIAALAAGRGRREELSSPWRCPYTVGWIQPPLCHISVSGRTQDGGLAVPEDASILCMDRMN